MDYADMKNQGLFYSHVICSGTKIELGLFQLRLKFYSHVICSGTKMVLYGTL